MRFALISCLVLSWGCSSTSIRAIDPAYRENLILSPAEATLPGAAVGHGGSQAGDPAGTQQPSGGAERDGAPALEELTETPATASLRQQADWGVAVVLRIAEVPYVSEEKRVSTFVPLLYYEGTRFFMRGLEGGAHLWRGETTEVNAIARLRFVDVPQELHDDVAPDAGDLGVQIHRDVDRAWWEAEWLTDRFGNWSAVGRIGATYVDKNWVVRPTFDVRYASAKYVSRYYGLNPITGIEAGADIIASPAVTARYRLISDFFLIGSVRYNALGTDIDHLSTIDDPGTWESFVGIGIFQDGNGPQFAGQPRRKDTADLRDIETVPHVRVAHAWATPSSFKDLFAFDIMEDEYDNQLTSIFYGFPLTDRLFGLPLDVFISPGLAYHYESDVQDETIEAILKIQLYYTLYWPIRWRLGIGEGLSWIEEPTYIERTALAENGQVPSELMNYLDLSIDLNAGDLLGAEGLEQLWVGVMAHHRSAIFEAASQFGDAKGGSNYVGFYLMWDIR